MRDSVATASWGPRPREEVRTARLALYTFGVLREPVGHPNVQGFVDRIEATFASAEATPGFLGRLLAADRPTGLAPRFFAPERHAAALQTLSWWADLESAHAFSYRGTHAEALRHRKEWFVPPAWPTYVTWWIRDDRTLTWHEGIDALERLHAEGPTPRAFNFKRPFDSEGRNLALDRSRVVDIAPHVR
jgi:hypothetical protein